MAVDARTKQILWGKAGATCAFPNCKRQLIRDSTTEDREVLVGEVAHIVAQSQGGPRRDNQVPDGNIDGYGNLILLCHEHHELVDQQYHTYSVDHLLQFKKDHEEWVRERLSKVNKFEGIFRSENLVTETLFSTLLPVSSIPHFIYSGECSLSELEVKSMLKIPNNSDIYAPFIIRCEKLYAFNDLTEFESPFSSA